MNIQALVRQFEVAAAAQRPLRPLMVTPQFLPEVFGGAEQQCLRLAVALRSLGHRPEILTSRTDRRVPPEETLEGIPVHRLGVASPPQIGGRKIGSTLAWTRAALRWWRRQGGHFDLIHCHQAKLHALFALMASRESDCPLILKIGTAGSNFDLRALEKKRYGYGKLLAHRIAKRADRVVSISSDMSQDILSFGISQERHAFIPNGLPSHYCAQRLGRRHGRGVFVGRLEKQKNLTTLIEALPMVPGFELDIVGAGTLESELRVQAKKLGLLDRIRFRGQVDDVRPYLVEAEIFVLPALAEGLSNALLEAMGAGLVPVASAVSGNTDLIKHNVTGFLYDPPENASALACALRAALKADRAAIGAVCTARMHSEYGMKRIAEQYLALYRDVLEERRLQ